MPNYAICRIKKLNTPAKVKSMKRHNERDNNVSNADPKIENICLLPFGRSSDAYQNVVDLLPEKRRSNAVLAVEHVLTTSPEFFEGKTRTDVLNWARQSHNFLKEKYGEDRIAYSTLHLDEKTPHIHAVIVPLEMGEDIDPETGKTILDPSVVKDKLNARQIFGGKEKMVQLQNDYHKSVEFLGLERGIKGSTAKHIDIKKFYEIIQDDNLLQSIKENMPVKEGRFDLNFEKRKLEYYMKKVSPVASLNIQLLKDLADNGSAPLKKHIDEMGIDMENFKKENEIARRNIRRLEKSLKDAEILTKRQHQQINNVAEHYSKHWKVAKEIVMQKFEQVDKQIEADKQIKPKQSKGMNMSM